MSCRSRPAWMLRHLFVGSRRTAPMREQNSRAANDTTGLESQERSPAENDGLGYARRKPSRGPKPEGGRCRVRQPRDHRIRDAENAGGASNLTRGWLTTTRQHGEVPFRARSARRCNPGTRALSQPVRLRLWSATKDHGRRASSRTLCSEDPKDQRDESRQGRRGRAKPIRP